MNLTVKYKTSIDPQQLQLTETNQKEVIASIIRPHLATALSKLGSLEGHHTCLLGDFSAKDITLVKGITHSPVHSLW